MYAVVVLKTAVNYFLLLIADSLVLRRETQSVLYYKRDHWSNYSHLNHRIPDTKSHCKGNERCEYL